MKFLDVCRFSAISEYHVANCTPGMQLVLRQAIRRAPRWLDFAVTCGYRNEVDQNEAFRKRRSTKRWPDSLHNRMPSPAADIRPASPFAQGDWQDVVRFGRIIGFLELVAIDEGVPLRCGLDWDMDGRTIDEKLRDLGHIEEMAA